MAEPVTAKRETLPGSQFRWRYQDDAVGEAWSDWHTVDGACSACCHGGPHDGEQQQGGGYYDEDGVMDWGGHTRCDPRDIDWWVTVEWQS